MQNIPNDNYLYTPYVKCEKCTTIKCKKSQMTNVKMYNYQVQNISNDKYLCTSNDKCKKCTTNKCKIFQMISIYVH